jgi:tetratricopeptide (TPR) repeat protein
MNQGYLRWWPRRYRGVHVLRHPGVNLAPWNVDNHALAKDGAAVTVDGSPVIFFHFSGLVPDGGAWASFHSHRRRQLAFLRESVYGPYLAAVEAEDEQLRRDYGIDSAGNRRSELNVRPDVLRFRSATATALTPPEVVRGEDAEVELGRHRRALRALVDARMFEAALAALRSTGPPLDGRYPEWDYLVAYSLQALNRDREAALWHYTKALELGFDEFWVRLHRGQLLLKLRRRHEARRDLERAFELRPAYEGLADLLRKA